MTTLDKKGEVSMAEAREYLRAAFSENTLKAYAKWRGAYLRFCTESGLDPYTIEGVSGWLLYAARKPYKLATIQLSVAAIKALWETAQRGNPFEVKGVQTLLRGIKRTLGTAKRQVRPLTPAVLANMRWDTGVKGLRDMAFILTGFMGALRVSELCALHYEDIEFVLEGVILTIRRSKTDQEGKGRQVAIPRLGGPICPVRALESYLVKRGRGGGPLFQSLRKGMLTGKSLSQRGAQKLIKDYVDRAGLDPAQFSTHSMRAGFVTTAALQGAELDQIACQTGHKSMEVLRGYIRRANLFQRNAATLVAKALR